MMIQYLTLSSIALLVGFFIVMFILGIPIQKSLSAYYYVLQDLPDKNGHPRELGWVFCWMIGLIGVLTTLYGVVFPYPSNSGGAFFVAGVGLLLVAFAPQFRNNWIEKFHYAGAAIAIIAGFVAIGWWQGDFRPLLTYTVSLAILTLFRKRLSLIGRLFTLIVELIAFFLIWKVTFLWK
jgi:hypothetical protein